MSDQVQVIPVESWRELRDDRGKLCGRVDAARLLLEVRRNQETVVFDLHDYLDLPHEVAISPA